MFSDFTRPHPSDSETPESNFRLGMMLAELWHDWFEAMSEVAYQMHRACEFLAEHKGFSNGRYGPFDSRFSRGPFEGLNGSIDVDKLKECLQSMDPAEAAKIMHAVQVMQAMDAMLKRRRSRGSEAEGDAW
jgi:hypothetical protein